MEGSGGGGEANSKETWLSESYSCLFVRLKIG